MQDGREAQACRFLHQVSYVVLSLEAIQREARSLRAEVKAGRPPPIEVPTQQARDVTRTVSRSSE